MRSLAACRDTLSAGDPQTSIRFATSHEFPCDRFVRSDRLSIIAKEKDTYPSSPWDFQWQNPQRNIVWRRYANSPRVRLNVCQPLPLEKRSRLSLPSRTHRFVLLALPVHKITRAGDTVAGCVPRVCCTHGGCLAVDLMYAGTPCYLSYPENSAPHCDCNRRLLRVSSRPNRGQGHS